MLQLGWFGLTNPWLLAALVSLPVLWWLLRIIPPAPRYIRFPAIRFLLGLEPEEQTSARTPPWLLFLRLLLAALLILALAGPVFNPEPELSGDGPLSWRSTTAGRPRRPGKSACAPWNASPPGRSATIARSSCSARRLIRPPRICVV